MADPSFVNAFETRFFQSTDPYIITAGKGGKISIPKGSIWDLRKADVQLPGTLRTEIRDEILGLVPNELSGNLIHENTNSTATDSVNSMVLASNTGTITGNVGLNNALYDGILCSNNCYSDGAVSNSLIESSVNSHFSNPTTPAMTNLNLIGCSSCSINNTSSNSTPVRCSIISSNTSSINTTGTASSENDSSIIASGAATMTLTGGCGMLACSTCSQSGSDTSNRVAISAIVGAYGCSQTGLMSQCAIMGAGASTMIVPVGKGMNQSAIVGSYNSDIYGSYYRSIIAGCGGCNLLDNSTTGFAESNGALASTSCTMTRSNLDKIFHRNLFISTDSASITDGGADTYNNAMISCNGGSIVGGIRTMISACQGSYINGLGANNSAIIASRLSGMPNTGTNSTLVETNLIGTSYQCFITRNPANFPLYRNTLLSSSTCTITNAIRETTNSLLSSSRECTIDGGNYNSIISSYLCTVKTNTGATAPPLYSSILSSSNCTIGTVNSYGITTAVIASDNCVVNQGTYNAVIASNNAVFGGSVNHNRCVALCSTGATFTNPSANVLLGGSTAISSNGYSNCIAWGASPTASNQAVFGVNTRIAGSGNNLAVEGGYVRASSGFVDNVRSASAPTTLAFGDSTIILNSGSTLTLPLAATFGANYPLDTVVKFKVVRAAAGSNNTISTTGIDRFNDTANWASLIDTMNGRHPYLEILLINTTIKPHWRFAHPIKVGATFHSFSIDNNFGVAPPKSDANQLPTSTTQATHEALGATSYVYLWQTAEQTQGVLSLSLTGTYGVQINVPAAYRITYRFDVRTVSGGSRYLIRSDVRQNSTGLTILGSYAETAGLNVQDGTRHVEVTLPTAFYDVGEILTIRLSQDATSTISATANIRAPAMILDGQI